MRKQFCLRGCSKFFAGEKWLGIQVRKLEIWLLERIGPDFLRAGAGFLLGTITLAFASRIFLVNTFDFENIQYGIRFLLQGGNPWNSATRIEHFYNPPFAVMFLWPMLFLNSRIFLALGAGLLMGFAFYHRAWTALAWFFSNSMLFLISAGGIDMFIIGSGLWLLIAGDRRFQSWGGLILRVLGFGCLLVKPQGGLFIVLLFIFIRRDWKAGLVAFLLYFLPFAYLYPDWVRVIFNDPPPAQVFVEHSLAGRFGYWVALPIAVLCLVARRWKYWQLGAVFASVLSPYGMPGVPIFLILASLRSIRAGLVFFSFSAILAVLTWVDAPVGVNYYEYAGPYLTIYNLSMVGLALALACVIPSQPLADGKNRYRFLEDG